MAGWGYRVGLNWGRSRLRRRRREVTTAFPPDVSHADVIAHNSMTRALARLSTDHRAVVVGRFYLDWSEAEVANGDAANGSSVLYRTDDSWVFETLTS